MKLRTAAALAMPLAACLTLNAQAVPPSVAPKPLVVTDQVGDGNGVNDQTLIEDSPVPIPEGTKTDPAQVAAFDIKSVTIGALGGMAKRKVGKKMVSYFNCTGYYATLELSGPPITTGTLYRIRAVTQLHSDTFWLQWNNPAVGSQSKPVGDSTTTLRFDDPSATLGTKSINLANPAKVDGNKITFLVTDADLKQAGEKLGKTWLSGLGADIRTNTGVVTAPQWDQLITDGTQVWKVCPQ